MTEDITKIYRLMNTKFFVILQTYHQLKNLIKKIVKGFTTNPSLMRKAGAKDYKSYSKQILKVCRINQFHLKYLLMIKSL